MSFKGTSRTDAGVHALRNVVSIDLMRAHTMTYPSSSSLSADKLSAQTYSANAVKSAINFYLDTDDIYITDCCMVVPDFNAHASVDSRTYMYKVIVPKRGRKAEPVSTSNLSSKRMFHR